MKKVLQIYDWLKAQEGCQFICEDDYFIVSRIADNQTFKILDIVFYQDKKNIFASNFCRSWIIGFAYDNTHVYLHNSDVIEINEIIFKEE